MRTYFQYLKVFLLTWVQYVNRHTCERTHAQTYRHTKLKDNMHTIILSIYDAKLNSDLKLEVPYKSIQSKRGSSTRAVTSLVHDEWDSFPSAQEASYYLSCICCAYFCMGLPVLSHRWVLLCTYLIDHFFHLSNKVCISFISVNPSCGHMPGLKSTGCGSRY